MSTEIPTPKRRHTDDKPPPKEILLIALIGLIGVTGGAVGGMVWNVVVKNGSTDGLTTLAAVGVGALASILGARGISRNNDERS